MYSSVVAAAAAGLAVVMAAGGSAAAAPSVKPGLWEMRVKTKMAAADLPPGMGENSTTIKFCITPDQAKASWQDMIKQMQGAQQNECAISDLKESGGTYSFTTKCKSGMSGTMKGTITPTSLEQSGDMVFEGEGMNMKMTYANSGKWLADVCPPGTLGAPAGKTR